MPAQLSPIDDRLKKLETRLAICYVVLMFCGAAILGFVIHELNLPALCR